MKYFFKAQYKGIKGSIDPASKAASKTGLRLPEALSLVKRKQKGLTC